MHPRTVLSTGNLFLAIAATLASYTLFPYLASFISATYVGLIFSAGSALAVVCFFFLPRLVVRYGSQQLVLYLAFAEMIMLFAAAASPHSIMSAICIILVISLQPLLYYGLDLLLEATVDAEATTGRVRTLFITGGNVGAFVAPLLIVTLLANAENYTFIFFAAAASVMPFLALFSARNLPTGSLPGPAHLQDAAKRILHDRDLLAVTLAHFVLCLFYVWAPFYVPVYLHNVLNIPWSTLGWILSIMLIPYIFIEYPAGWLADKFLGDKELMFAGFFIMGAALMAVGFLTSASSILVITITLLMTRVGAALSESMNEGHFFRRVSERNIESVSIFRGLWPLANAVAPLLGILLFMLDGYNLFFILTGGFVAIAGMLSVLFIKDFR